jgi:hypothetical protein
MRLLTALSLATAIAIAGCAPAAPPAPAAPAAPAAEVKATLNQVMRGILFPNSNIIFDAQDQDPGKPPEASAGGDTATALYAGTYGGWEAVENASMALTEAANLIALPGRVCNNDKPVPLDDPVYQKGLQALRDVAKLSYDTAKAKNFDAMLDVADKVTQACSTCHDVFRDRVVDGKPIGMADRCTKG